ncbi:uncharacterized protein [Physcomitrium patens]|uniref:uncharacterized protein n=1 Tax=Physcomitrium patens TaxID=3218 RepID=UPI003CCD7AC1
MKWEGQVFHLAGAVIGRGKERANLPIHSSTRARSMLLVCHSRDRHYESGARLNSYSSLVARASNRIVQEFHGREEDKNALRPVLGSAGGSGASERRVRKLWRNDASRRREWQRPPLCKRIPCPHGACHGRRDHP